MASVERSIFLVEYISKSHLTMQKHCTSNAYSFHYKFKINLLFAARSHRNRHLGNQQHLAQAFSASCRSAESQSSFPSQKRYHPNVCAGMHPIDNYKSKSDFDPLPLIQRRRNLLLHSASVDLIRILCFVKQSQSASHYKSYVNHCDLLFSGTFISK